MLFAKMGLNYDLDVPFKIKQQLMQDPNSKQILINLTKKFEAGELNFLFEQHNLKPSPMKRKNIPKPATQVRENGEPLNSVRPNEDTTIKITNTLNPKHDNHPINKLLKLINQFCQLTMTKAGNHRISGNSKEQITFDN